jgi:hypothetical protein
MPDSTITEAAADNLRAITEHVEGIAYALGKTSPHYIESVSSWIQVQRQVAGWLHDGGRLVADGRLSFGVDGFIYIGVIFFRDRRFDVAYVQGEDDRSYVCTNHGEPYPYEAWCCLAVPTDNQDEARSRECSARTPIPTPGTWSCHS